MTDRLYYTDSYKTRFAANVVEQHSDGGRTAVVLDVTAFYPSSGGQPHDTGSLGSARILEVAEDDSGQVLHFLDSPIAPGLVEGVVDWPRRFDHMQQHTGQHILSQALIRVAGAATVSFHMGAETSTIDVELASPSFELLGRAEEEATQVVFDDRPVTVLSVGSREQEAMGVRKTSDREGEIRVIDIDGYDRSPCGGTHVRRTGEIGMISVLAFERYKGGTRIEFACGGRVLNIFRRDHETLRTLGRLLSAHPLESPRLVEMLREERVALTRENARLQNLVVESEARDLVASAESVGRRKVVDVRFGDRNVEQIRLLAQKIALDPSAVAVLVLEQDPAQVVVAAGAEAGIDCSAVVRRTTAAIGGRGGGKTGLAQAGGIPAPDLAAWLAALHSALRGSE